LNCAPGKQDNAHKNTDCGTFAEFANVRNVVIYLYDLEDRSRYNM